VTTTTLKDQRAVVMGLGRFGGGVGVARWLHDQGADVLVTDLASADSLTDSLSQLPEGIDTRLGAHDAADFAVADLVVVNPAVPKPWRHELLQTAQQHAVLVTSEIELLVERLPYRKRVIGVTGSAGKSTTATLIAEGLRSMGRTAHLGGNIGGSLLTDLETINEDDDVVLELSSAQLWWLARSRWSPGIAVVTNIAPNHLDWHNDFAHYEKAKKQILADQEEDDVAVLPDELADWSDRRARTVEVDRPLRLIGQHNDKNAALALSAIAAACRTDDLERAREAIARFPGLPHRLQRLDDQNGVRIVNDSKSTTPGSTLLAVIAAGGPAGVRLIAGGYDKGVDLSAISDLAPMLAGLYTIGATASAIGGKVCGDLETAVGAALADAEAGETILLSPGCASWDQFADFRERGDRFAELAGSGVDGVFGSR